MDDKGFTYAHIHDYFTNHKAVYEAEETIVMKGCGTWFDWDNCLCKVTGDSRPLHASPEHRAKALVLFLMIQEGRKTAGLTK